MIVRFPHPSTALVMSRVESRVVFRSAQDAAIVSFRGQPPERRSLSAALYKVRSRRGRGLTLASHPSTALVMSQVKSRVVFRSAQDAAIVSFRGQPPERRRLSAALDKVRS